MQTRYFSPMLAARVRDAIEGDADVCAAANSWATLADNASAMGYAHACDSAAQRVIDAIAPGAELVDTALQSTHYGARFDFVIGWGGFARNGAALDMHDVHDVQILAMLAA